MASGGGKRGAGERVLEGKHVIGLFLIMLLFSGLFFTLGYVMGRNQFDNPVRAAASGNFSRPEPTALPKADSAPRKRPQYSPTKARPILPRPPTPSGSSTAITSPRKASRAWKLRRRPRLFRQLRRRLVRRRLSVPLQLR